MNGSTDRRRVTVIASGALIVIAAGVAVGTHLWTAVDAAAGPAAPVGPPARPARPPVAASTHGVYSPAPAASSFAPARPLAGQVIGIDPGHNGRNGTDPAYIDRMIWNGREQETCDTTGTETDSGYTEAQFNFNVAMYLRADLKRQGPRWC